MSGLTATGFERKRLVDIKKDIEDRLKLVFGKNIDLNEQSGFGQFVGIESEAQADQWEVMENVYNSQYPSTAQGVQLSNVVLLNGIERQEAKKSTVKATVWGNTGTVIAAGSRVATKDTNSIFIVLFDTVIGVNGVIVIDLESEKYGKIEAGVETITVIKTPIYGWTSITNFHSATIGRDEETDSELRIRRLLSTQTLGQNLVDSLYGQLLNLTGVSAVLVKSNGTDAIVEGIPAHQFLSIILGGVDEDIASIVWANTPQGIASYGAETIVHTDAQGFPQDVMFSRPAEINIYFAIDITTDSSFPATGLDDIKQAVVDYGIANFSIHDDVVLSQFYTPINSIAGVLSIDLKIGTTSPATGTVNIAIALAEVSMYAIINVEVTDV